MAEQQKRVINIGVIGAGCIAENHLMSISLVVANARKIWGRYIKPVLYAIADINEERLKLMAENFGPQLTFTGTNAAIDLITHPDIHAVFVLVPTKYHLEYVLRAAALGKHVFCEKPLAFSPKDVQLMIDAREQYKVVLAAGLVFRSAPQIIYLKHLIEQNRQKWGKPTNIIFRDSQQKPYLGAEEVHNSTWRADQNLAHAGILFEHTIHDIDGMISIFGKIKEVFAKVEYHANKPGIEDSVAAILTFDNGVNLSVNSMWNNIDFSARRFELFFENAYIMVTVDERAGKAVQIKIKEGKDPEYELDDTIMDQYFRDSIKMGHIKSEITGPYYYEDLRFIDAIVRNSAAEVTLEAGQYVQTVIEACYESSRSRKIISVAEK
jgi:predicted dehydrogenase